MKNFSIYTDAVLGALLIFAAIAAILSYGSIWPYDLKGLFFIFYAFIALTIITGIFRRCIFKFRFSTLSYTGFIVCILFVQGYTHSNFDDMVFWKIMLISALILAAHWFWTSGINNEEKSDGAWLSKRQQMVFAAAVSVLTIIMLAVAQNDDIWEDTRSDLMWQVKTGTGPKSLEQAEYYCRNLKINGYDDWRLPSISELRSLIRGCPNTETGGACRVTDSCLMKSCLDPKLCEGTCVIKKGPGSRGAYLPEELLGSVGYYWSSSIVPESVHDFQPKAWHVLFADGRVSDYFLHGSWVRCVR